MLTTNWHMRIPCKRILAKCMSSMVEHDYFFSNQSWWIMCCKIFYVTTRSILSKLNFSRGYRTTKNQLLISVFFSLLSSFYIIFFLPLRLSLSLFFNQCCRPCFFLLFYKRVNKYLAYKMQSQRMKFFFLLKFWFDITYLCIWNLVVRECDLIHICLRVQFANDFSFVCLIVEMLWKKFNI